MTDTPVRPRRVLIVDDDPDQRLVLRRMLARAGITDVTEASDGDAGLEAAITLRPDLVVLDLAMPNRSGMEVLPDLHEALPSTAVVVLSNFPRRRMAHLVRARGALGYVEKRVSPDRLVAEILLAAALTGHAADRLSSSFASAATSAAEAREFVRQSLDAPTERLLADVELLVSELVTNAIVHAGSSPRVDVIVDRESFRVEVYDDSPAMPELRPPNTTSTGGRGVFLMDRLSSRWGAEPHGTGKVVWFERDRSDDIP